MLDDVIATAGRCLTKEATLSLKHAAHRHIVLRSTWSKLKRYSIEWTINRVNETEHTTKYDLHSSKEI